TDALLTLAVALGVEAALIGIYATLRTDPATAWAAAVLSATAYGLYADALLTEPVDLLWVTGPIGAALLAGWAALAITNRPDRLVLWLWPALALAQAALATAAIVAIDALVGTAAFDVIAVITAWEALLFALVATTTVTPSFAFVSTVFTIGSYAALVHRFELDGARYVLAWMALTLFGTVAATVTGRFRERVRVGTWVWPLNAAAATAGSLTVMSAVVHFTPPDAGLVTAAIVAALGIHLLVNRPIFAPHVPVEMAAATAFVAAGALSASSLDPQTPWTFAVLFAMSVVAAIAAPLVQRLDASAATAAFILVAGYTVIPVVAAAAFWGPLSPEVGYLLIVTGGALAAYGVVARKLLAFEGAVAIWLCSMLILLNHRFGLQLHATIVLVSVVLLAVLEVERYRHRRDGQPQPEALRVVEWIAMTVPLLLAASETFGSLVYALLLAAEGAALIVWAGLTRVRRRAVVGLIAVTTAMALGVMIPLFDEVRHGLAGGTWLIIGATAAIVMIAAGSVIERQRAQIGKRLSRWGELLESWE
ncbi:MAG: hypothetical protein U9R47_06845, partial [Actinomycetota bacterium]|nr:hypothetical protein [Actinomycetota bacterium]